MSTSGQKRIESTIDTAIDCDEDEVMKLAMQAGELLLENGAEIFRVEETMDRICRHYGVESASQFILMKIYGFRSLSGIGDDSPDAGQEKKRADSGFRCGKRCFLLPFRGQSDGLSGGSHCRISDLCLYSLYQRPAFVKDCG